MLVAQLRLLMNFCLSCQSWVPARKDRPVLKAKPALRALKVRKVRPAQTVQQVRKVHQDCQGQPDRSVLKAKLVLRVLKVQPAQTGQQAHRDCRVRKANPALQVRKASKD
jgi:hypothetical protein